MQEKHLFEYAIVRLVPCVEREEFVNVGVVVYCREKGFLRSAFELNEARVRAICSDVDIDEVTEHLRSFEQICTGGESAGPIGKLPAGRIPAVSGNPIGERQPVEHRGGLPANTARER